MTTYIIGYDINKEGAAYAEANKKLTEAIREQFPTFWHHLDSTWIVVTEKTAVQIRDSLKSQLDKDDELLVVASGGVGAWHGFNEAGSSWLKKNL